MGKPKINFIFLAAFIVIGAAFLFLSQNHPTPQSSTSETPRPLKPSDDLFNSLSEIDLTKAHDISYYADQVSQVSNKHSLSIPAVIKGTVIKGTNKVFCVRAPCPPVETLSLETTKVGVTSRVYITSTKGKVFPFISGQEYIIEGILETTTLYRGLNQVDPYEVPNLITPSKAAPVN